MTYLWRVHLSTVFLLKCLFVVKSTSAKPLACIWRCCTARKATRREAIDITPLHWTLKLNIKVFQKNQNRVASSELLISCRNFNASSALPLETASATASRSLSNDCSPHNAAAPASFALAAAAMCCFCAAQYSTVMYSIHYVSFRIAMKAFVGSTLLRSWISQSVPTCMNETIHQKNRLESRFPDQKPQ